MKEKPSAAVNTGSMLQLICLALILFSVFTLVPTQSLSAPRHGRLFLSFHHFDMFTATPGLLPGQHCLTSPPLETSAPWDELIASWNAIIPPEAALRVEVRALYPDHTTKYYDLGYWAGNDHFPPRSSPAKQRDDDGDVATDTLILQKPASRLQVRITLEGDAGLKFLGLSFWDSHAPKEATHTPDRAAWGHMLPVPERCQLSYSGGDVLCSPTSVSMVMAYWAKIRHQPQWDVDVPEAAKGIYDPGWGGTGNWPFNAAYAGSFPGLHAEIARLEGLYELEEWITAGVPVIVSGSYEGSSAGHIMVCVGFTEHGDVIVNDPWAHLDKGQQVRKIFPRAKFAGMWADSKNTVYLIYPDHYFKEK